VTAATKPDRRGEHEGNRNTIAQGMPEIPVNLWWTYLRAFYFLHAELRVQPAPGIPCLL
jgi:hypothetical protein